MKITFLSNFYNHHQSQLSNKIYELTDGNYRFVETSIVPDERKRMGYSDSKPEFVLKSYDRDDSDEIQKWINTSDVVISGYVAEELLEQRKKEKKLILRYSERPLKNGFKIIKYPYSWIKWRKYNPPGVPIYLLCAGAYTLTDYSLFGLFKNKAFQWGYFPEIQNYEDVDDIIAQKDKKEILWCGRFLDWKHPDNVLKVAKRLMDDSIDFHISVIGAGEMTDVLSKYCIEHKLENNIDFLGTMSPQEVRERMKKSGCFLFTSDRKEGWGAVLNEAMNSACAVVASYEAGSTPYLIKNNINGLGYHCDDVDSLSDKVKFLLNNPEEQSRMGKSAYYTITKEWNAGVAAERLITICDNLLKNNDINGLYASGPCSSAIIVKEKQF